jgi:ABC-type transport system involved in multi-copper enzyme maturation permease subunit
MFWHLLSTENTKIFRRRLFWTLLVLIAIVVMIIEIVLYATFENGLSGIVMPAEDRLNLLQMITWPRALVNVLTLVGGNAFGGLLFVILVGAVTSQEYNWRTLHLWLSRGVPRPILRTAKFAAFIAPALLIVLTALVAGGVITAIISFNINNTLHLDEMNSSQVVISILRTAYTLLPYGAVTYFLAVISRSTVVAISGGLVYTLLLEDILIQMLGLIREPLPLQRMIEYMPSTLADNMLALNQAVIGVEGSSPAGSGSPLTAALGIAAWVLLFLGLSLWIFQRQNLSE